LEYLDKAPADAQKSLIFALIKEIVIHSDVIDLRMYLGDPEQTLQADIHDCDHNKTAVKNKNPVPELLRNGADVNDQALVAHGRPKWLPLEDSNLGPGGYT